ncbi:MAG: NAD(P)-binding domain-containing protein, partial [Pigmentiphaga sp.]
MKVLVIGAGNMGSGFVKQLSAAGHQVSVTARNMAKAQAVAQPYGAKAVPAAGSADAVDAVVLA